MLSRTEDVSMGSPHGAWLVHYEIDLVLSDPGMVPLYRMPVSQYAKAVGCTH